MRDENIPNRTHRTGYAGGVGGERRRERVLVLDPERPHVVQHIFQFVHPGSVDIVEGYGGVGTAVESLPETNESINDSLFIGFLF